MIPEKPTTHDIARVAGVSLATVDRVLNARPGVRSITVERVRNAIDELGYVRDTAAANLARKRYYNLLFILPAIANDFIVSIEQQIELLTATLVTERTRVRYKKVTAFDPQETVKVIGGIDPAEVDGVAIFGPETPSVRDEIGRLKNKGIAVVALVSDLPSSGRDHFVGIDNVSAGRTAAQLMGRFLSERNGRILVVTGSRLARDHLDRRLGFDEVMANDFPDQSVLPSLEALDDPELLAKLLPETFKTFPDICGIYSSAAGNEGLIRFLRENNVGNEIVVVGHELTQPTRLALNEGTFDAIISQDTGHLVRSAIRLLRATVDEVPFNSAQEVIRIDIYLKENMPPLNNEMKMKCSIGRTT